MKHEATEAKQRHLAGQVLLGATIAGIVEMGIKQVANYVPRMGQGVVEGLGKFFQLAGRALGVFGVTIMAGWDVKQAVDNLMEGNIGLGVAYFGSAALGFASFVLFAVGSTGVGIIAVLLLMAVVAFIETYKDNKVQDWLERLQSWSFCW